MRLKCRINVPKRQGSRGPSNQDNLPGVLRSAGHRALSRWCCFGPHTGTCYINKSISDDEVNYCPCSTQLSCERITSVDLFSVPQPLADNAVRKPQKGHVFPVPRSYFCILRGSKLYKLPLGTSHSLCSLLANGFTVPAGWFWFWCWTENVCPSPFMQPHTHMHVHSHTHTRTYLRSYTKWEWGTRKALRWSPFLSQHAGRLAWLYVSRGTIVWRDG